MGEEYKTKTGRVLTDDDLDALVAEAEVGYDMAKVKRRAGAQMPTRAYPGDAGHDLYYSGEAAMLIMPNAVVWVPSEVAIQWPDGVWGLIIGRSSSFEKGLLVNPTVIDAGFRGTLGAFVRNVHNDWVTVQPGERVAQIVPMPLLAGTFPMVEVDELDPSERGEKGFGSSGR